MTTNLEDLARDIRIYIFRQAAEPGRVAPPDTIAGAMNKSREDVENALRHLAAGKVLILAPNTANIWAANPFCAVPSGFRVEAAGKSYWGICIWDSMGIAAAINKDAVIHAPCGDCGEMLELEIKTGKLVRGAGVVQFAVPATRWWDNIGFT